MDVEEAIKARRSIRRFQNRELPQALLERLMATARFYPSAANLQPLRFLVVSSPDLRAQIFRCLSWAGYLSDYQIPPGHRPTAYILLLGDLAVSRRLDFSAGAAATELMLTAQALGLASCCLEPSDRETLSGLFGLDPARHKVLYAIALGYPDQTSRIQDMTDSPRYTLDGENNFIVPKRKLADIVRYL